MKKYLPFHLFYFILISEWLYTVHTKEIIQIFKPQFLSINKEAFGYNQLKNGYPKSLWLRIRPYGLAHTSQKISLEVFLSNHKYQSTSPIYVVNRNSTAKEFHLMERNRNCHYDCHESPGGAVIGTINLCHGVRGYLETQARSMHVFPLKDDHNSSRLINSSHKLRIGPLGNSYNNQYSHNSFIHHQARNLHRKSILKRRKRSLNYRASRIFSDRDPNIVELYMIVDEIVSQQYLYKYRSYGTLVDKIYLMISEMNMAYATFNIRFVLVRLDIYEKDVVPLAKQWDSALMRTLYQLKRRSVQYVRHDCMHALVSQHSYSSVRGKAKEKTMCSATQCYGFSRDTPNAYEIETARTMIHELGHNFGLKHDTENCLCHDCLMSTGTEYNMSQFKWSVCSIQQMNDLMKFGINRCLRDRPENITLVPVETKKNGFQKYELPNLAKTHYCGNGIVEEGEECDCGSGSVSTSLGCPEELRRCCDPRNCRFTEGASCASGECCDRSTCQPMKAGAVCRNKEAECDLPEYCNGTSEWCPDNRRKANGVECTTETNEKAYCFDGQCATSKSWCQVLWGHTAQASHSSCFDENLSHTRDIFKNCGVTGPSSYGLPASSWDVKRCDAGSQFCGRLWCTHLNEKLNIQGYFEEKIITDRNGYDCHAVSFDSYWNLTDPGMVPNGAPCGDNKMCFQGRCIPAKVFIPANKSCDCNERGVCNDKGNCHCDQWFKPPFCMEVGNGGSIDSGPPPSGWHQQMVTQILLCVFLFVVPLISLLLFIIVYFHLHPDKADAICTGLFTCRFSICHVCPRLSLPAKTSKPPVKNHVVNEDEEITVSTPLTPNKDNPSSQRIYKSNGNKSSKRKHSKSKPTVAAPVKSNRSQPDLIKEAAPAKRLLISEPHISQTSLDLTSGFFDLKPKDDSPISSSIFKELCSQGIVDSEYSRELIEPKQKLPQPFPQSTNHETTQSLHSIVKATEEESRQSSQSGKQSRKTPLRSSSVRNDIKSVGNKIKQPVSNIIDKARVSQSKLPSDPPPPVERPQISLPHLQETSCTVKTQDLPDSNYSLLKDIKPTRPGALLNGQKAVSKPARPVNKPTLPPRPVLQRVYLNDKSDQSGIADDYSKETDEHSPRSTYV